MGVNIHVKPEDIWPFFENNKTRLTEEMVSVAENEETEYEIYLTEENGYPLFYVYRGELEIDSECAVSLSDCALTAKSLYTKYLFPVMVTIEKEEVTGERDENTYDDFPYSLQDMEDEVYEREDELHFAAIDFLQVVLGYSDMDRLLALYGEELVNAFVDDMCQYLMDFHDISVYRPMLMVDDTTAEETLVEFPYDLPDA